MGPPPSALQIGTWAATGRFTSFHAQAGGAGHTWFTAVNPRWSNHTPKDAHETLWPSNDDKGGGAATLPAGLQGEKRGVRFTAVNRRPKLTIER